MPTAILPAAGSSSRMGRRKLLLPFAETTVLGATVAALRGGGVSEIVVVAAPADEALAAQAASLGARVAINPEPERGMLTSIWAGLAAVGGAAACAERGDWLLVCPADLPLLKGETVAALLRQAASGDALLVVPRNGETRGHPLLIHPRLTLEIADLDPAVGLRQLRWRHRERTLEVEVADAGVIADVDTPEDYAALSGDL